MKTTSRTTEEIYGPETFIGNRPLHVLDLVGPDKRTLREKYIIGEPANCAAGSAAEMKRRGFVGIYRKNPVVFYRLPNSSQLIQKIW